MSDDEKKDVAPPDLLGDDSDAESVISMKPEEKNEHLMNAVKSNNAKEVLEYIDLGADVNTEKDNWNPLLWAACNGNEEIVRILIDHNAHLSYLDE